MDNCFKYLDRVKILVSFQANEIANEIALTSLYITRAEDYRRRYLYLLKVVDKICCSCSKVLISVKIFQFQDMLN
jgi:hypothetical protein